MDNSAMLTYLVIGTLVAFGIYRKNHGPADQLVMNATESFPNLGQTQGVYRASKDEVARVVFEVEKKLPDQETITQVYDYSNQPKGSGILHKFDVATFNAATTQALTKRISCIQRGPDVEILSAELISPVTGTTQRNVSVLDEMIDTVVDGPSDGGDSRFVRDKYTFIQKDNELPPEPQLGEHAYEERMIEYQKQINDIRAKGSYTKSSDIKFAPTSARIETERKFPFEMPQSFGHAEHTSPPLDFSAINLIEPLKDEQFFDVISAKRSALAIQYG